MHTTSPLRTPSGDERVTRPRVTARQSGDSVVALQRHLGNAALSRFVQARLTVSHPSDPCEQEAEQVADQIMRMPVSTGPERVQVQRLCPGCEEELDRRALVRRAGDSGDGAVTAEVETALGGLAGRGEPLPEAVRADLEPRFGADFSAVRVHTDGAAQELARAVSAEAFTLGTDVVFGPGRYAPETDAGRHLLAHELTHVLQQQPGLPIARVPNEVPLQEADTRTRCGRRPSRGFE